MNPEYSIRLNQKDKVQEERVSGTERYRPLIFGGRIKAASVSMRYLYDASRPLIESPDSVDAAFETSKNFAVLKEKPPFPFRAAFFPQDEGAMRTAFRGLGIYRPTIKTDQGPGGNVGYFTMDDKPPSNLDGRIVREQGSAVLEAFVGMAIKDASLAGKFPESAQIEVTRQIGLVKHHYEIGEYRQTHEAIMKLREICQANNIESTRRAVVGREEFFLFRPIQTDRQITIGQDLTDTISQKTQEIIARIERKAAITRGLAGAGMPIKDAVLMANGLAEQPFQSNTDTRAFLYFQPDVLIRKDGTFDIERINMPDLGMFLTSDMINVPNDEGPLQAIKEINERIKMEVVEAVSAGSAGDIVLLTRDEVINNREDTLEHLELGAFRKEFLNQGRRADPCTLSQVNEIYGGSSVLLFNISTDAPGYEDLLRRVALGEIDCYPDPFVKLFETEATTFERKVIDPKVVDKFLKIIAPSNLDKPEGVHNKFKAIQGALQKGGIDNDIVYFSVGNDQAYIPTFRYDVKSFSEVHKAVQLAKRQGKKIDLTAIPIPFKPDDAILYGKDGPRLSLLRFMFVRK